MQEDEAADTQALERAERRGRIGAASLLALGVAAAALVAGWVERKPIVRHFVDERLAAAHVPGTYELSTIGPFFQRLDNVRIGDPAHPDLTARRIELLIGYSGGSPHVARVSAEGVRLSARVVNGQVSLGALDRLLPKGPSAAPFALPAIPVTLADTRFTLASPVGMLTAAIDGAGRLSDGFRGRVVASADRLQAAGCILARPRANVSISTSGGKPHLLGPLVLDSAACPSLKLGGGKAQLDVEGTPSLGGWKGRVDLAGFGGSGGGARFGGLNGRVTLAGDAHVASGDVNLAADKPSSPSLGSAARAELSGPWSWRADGSGLGFAGDVRLRGLSVAANQRQAIRSGVAGAAATPLAPIAAKAGGALDRLLAQADADARVMFTTGGTLGTAFRLQRLALAGAGGMTLRIEAGEGLGWESRDGGWRLDGIVETGGGELPAAKVAFHQSEAGGPIAGLATIAPYAAGDARLSLTPVSFQRAGGVTRFSTVATLDGPLGSGRVEGLALPLDGRFGPAGLTLGERCTPVAIRSLAIAGMTLDPAHLTLCGVNGAPLLSRGGFGATVANLRLTGRSGGAPLTLAAAHMQVASAGLSANNVAIRLGAADPRTSLDLKTLTGRFGADGIAGQFGGGAGRIGAVPLLLSDAGGDWRLAGGALSLKGQLTAADADESPHYKPLTGRDVALTFKDGRIAATGVLAEPASGVKVADVTLRHDFANGAGEAVLDVPGLTFAPKGLQPDALTPMTLGVIANVAGTVKGQGVIDWTRKGVTSHGDFQTDGTDLAAAFGPVNKVSGSIHFTDLLGFVTPPHQEVRIAEVNPGVAVSNGVAHYALVGSGKVQVEDAAWPFAGGTLSLEPSLLSFEVAAQRHLTFDVSGLDAATFVQQLDFPNIAATGTFDGKLPMIFDSTGGRIEGGHLTARKGGGTVAYVGELSQADIGRMGKLAFDALRKIRYNSLAITLDGKLDGEIISGVKFDGLRQDTGEKSIVSRMIRNLPFRFNIVIHAPFRGLMGSARAFVDPRILLGGTIPVPPTPPPPPAGQPPVAAPAPKPIQPSDSGKVR